MKFINMSNFPGIAIVLLLVLFEAHISSQNTYYPPADGPSWEQLDPAELNWCADSIAAMYEWLDDKNTKAFIVLQDGKIVLEEYFGTFQPDSLWLWASAGKTLTSFMMGQAQAEGLLQLDDPMSDYLGRGWTSLSPEREDSITIFHGLTMTSGLDESVDAFCTDPECLQYRAPAGTRWAYHNGPYTPLLSVLEEAYDQNINILINQLLKRPTGMDGLWIPLGYNRIYFSTARSMARFGWLIANDGRWENETLLDDAQYLADMRQPSQELNPSYGYLWWLNGQDAHMLPVNRTRFSGSMVPEAPSDAYFAIGASGQIIAIHPSTRRVIIRMGADPNEPGTPTAADFLREMHERLDRLSCGTVSVAEPSSKKLQVFPNPVQDELRWRSKASFQEVQLIHSSGYSYSYSAAEFSGQRLHIRHLPAGLYQFRALTIDGEWMSSAFVKMR